jgi:hypothetical protein
MSWPLQPPFQIDGPSNNPYPGMFCLPQVPLSLPDGVTVNVGDLATIQVVETTLEGSALYNVGYFSLLTSFQIGLYYIKRLQGKSRSLGNRLPEEYEN